MTLADEYVKHSEHIIKKFLKKLMNTQNHPAIQTSTAVNINLAKQFLLRLSHVDLLLLLYRSLCCLAIQY